MTWLTVLGIGEDGLDGLAPAARTLIETAEVLAGGARHLAMVADRAAERLEWASPFAASVEALAARRGRRVVVLASGDPMWFGVGATLSRHFTGEMTVLPHPGAFSLAAARLGWPLHETLCLSAHGRPLESLALHLFPGARLLVLGEDETSPARIAALLDEQGYGPSPLTVLERLGGPAERVRAGAAPCHPLSVVAIECRAAPATRPLPRQGLPDEAFRHDGQITKREIRAVTLSALAPFPGALLWDVGAGAGSVAIEWMRAGGRAIGFESRPGRAALAAANAARLGVPGLALVIGEAPGALAGEAPDAVFVGGGVSRPGVLDSAWAALKPGGRMVANAVTAEGEAALLAFHARQGGAMLRLALARLEPMGRLHGWQPAVPVTQWTGIKS